MKNDLNPVEAERRKEKARLRKKHNANHIKADAKGPEDHKDAEQDPELTNIKLGPRSIFYDPQWNPYGTVPKKYESRYKNLYYNPKKFHSPMEPASPAEKAVLEKIQLPPGEPPKFYKRDTATAVVERDERIDLMPTTLLRKKPRIN